MLALARPVSECRNDRSVAVPGLKLFPVLRLQNPLEAESVTAQSAVSKWSATGLGLIPLSVFASELVSPSAFPSEYYKMGLALGSVFPLPAESVLPPPSALESVFLPPAGLALLPPSALESVFLPPAGSGLPPPSALGSVFPLPAESGLPPPAALGSVFLPPAGLALLPPSALGLLHLSVPV